MKRTNRRRTALWIGLVLTAALVVALGWPLSDRTMRGGEVVSLRVTGRDGSLLREAPAGTGAGRGRPVRLDEVSPAVVAALVSVEDRSFYGHPGVNPLAIGRAAWANRRAGRTVSGGSTLTMQVARLLRGRVQRSMGDKLAEAWLALRLEAHLSKAAILELWLNRAAFGNGAHGIEAAARLYLGKSARDLTTGEAALLVGLPQAPTVLDPFRHPDRALARRRRVLAAMVAAGRLTPTERDRLMVEPVTVRSPERLFGAPHLTAALIGARSADDERQVAEIRTTIDPALQADVEGLARAHLAALGIEGVTNAAAVVLDNGTGEVLAYMGSVDFFDESTGGQNDGVRMHRQPGSALKPFTYARALASGRFTPASVLADIETQVLLAGGAFSPENYDRTYHGPVRLRTALACSYNVPVVRTTQSLGVPTVLATMRQAGFASLTRSAEHYGVGLSLGNGEVQLIELARAYAGLARGGTLPPVRVERWRRRVSGDTLRPAAAPVVSNGLDPRAIWLILDVLSDPEARAPAFGRGGPLELPFPCAIKTGTSKDFRDNWAVATTPRHTVAVWAGNFDNTPMRRTTGVTGAAPLAHAILMRLGGSGAFARPSGIVEAAICPVSGARPGRDCPATRREFFLVGTAPAETCAVHRMVLLDRRTGLLADRNTPRSAVESRLFTVFPPIFGPWMRAHGIAQPPGVSAAEIAARADTTLTYSDRLAVGYPLDGTMFQLDPVLRRAFQRIRPRAVVGPALVGASWWVDGKPLPGDLRSADWPLEPGRHTLELRALDAATGRRLRSRPVTVRVVEAG